MASGAPSSQRMEVNKLICDAEQQSRNAKRETTYGMNSSDYN